MFAGRKYRAELTAEQRAVAEGYAGVCRSVWNTGLEQRREYRRRGGWISYREQAGQLVDAKRDPQFAWLREPPGHVLQQVLMDLDKACRAHGTWAVRWKSKTHWQPSMRFPDGASCRVERLSRKWARVKLPKLGWVRFRFSRLVGGAVRSVTLRRDGTHWYVSILVDTPDQERTVSLKRGRIGVDRGVVTAVVTSGADRATGRGFFNREFMTPGETERYVRLQRRLARARKGSKRRLRLKAAMAGIMRRVRCRRQDFQAQTARVLVNGNALIVIEDLHTRGMTASAKGTPERPGRMVAQKRGLNRAILDKGWSGLETALRSAARTTGTHIRKINPAYTSQTCPVCKRVDADSRKSQAEFVCTACSHTETCGCGRGEEHTGRRAWRLQDVEPSRRRPGL